MPAVTGHLLFPLATSLKVPERSTGDGGLFFSGGITAGNVCFLKREVEGAFFLVALPPPCLPYPSGVLFQLSVKRQLVTCEQTPFSRGRRGIRPFLRCLWQQTVLFLFYVLSTSCLAVIGSSTSLSPQCVDVRLYVRICVYGCTGMPVYVCFQAFSVCALVCDSNCTFSNPCQCM